MKHDATGATKDCWTFDERTGSLVVASRDMVYFYEADQCIDSDGYRGKCLQLGRSHEKLQLISIGEHLVLVTKQHALIPSSDETEFMSMVTVYNVKGQYIGFSCSIPSLCRHQADKAELLMDIFCRTMHSGIMYITIQKNLDGLDDLGSR
ncbi:unnamed protein product [Heligmosomoides polygyrus]|uniref:PEP5/VPS11 N-terminal domain-containing protein n=1 Tax=Heligmosomoides polygyrus TaxID=6339 RepID=A0A3P7U0W6_HELPZ|nr:unnamed protein product [Heligmosomoides polygyrus]